MQTALNYRWGGLSTDRFIMPEFRRDRLRERRKDFGFTQQFLAKQSGVKQSQIAGWETGERAPSPDNVAKIAKVLEVTLDYLYGLVDKPQDTLREQGLSEKEFKVVHRYRSDALAQAMIDRALLIDQPKENPALPEPKKGNEDNGIASSGKHSDQD